MIRRVVFVNRFYDPDESATSQLLTDLARAAASAGYDTHVVCSRQLYGNARARLPARECPAGVHVHRVATTRFGRHSLPGRILDYASFYLAAAWTLFWILRRDAVLVIETDPPLMAVIGAPLASLRRAELINWQQDVFPEVAAHIGAGSLPRWLDRVLRSLRDHSLRAARMNVVIGERMRDYFRARGIAAERLCVIHNWAATGSIPAKPPEASRLRRELGLLDKFVVCYSGNLGRAHEFETLLEAAKLLREDDGIVFLMIGGGAKMGALERATQDCALRNFIFLPYQPRDTLEDSLAAADVHLLSLLPALEGLIVPSKLYGILAAGRPFVCIGDLDGEVQRFTAAADCGRFVGVGDALKLRDVLLDLKAQPQRRAAMGARGQGLLLAGYSAESALARWLMLIAGSADIHRNLVPVTDTPAQERPPPC